MEQPGTPRGRITQALDWLSRLLAIRDAWDWFRLLVYAGTWLGVIKAMWRWWIAQDMITRIAIGLMVGFFAIGTIGLLWDKLRSIPSLKAKGQSKNTPLEEVRDREFSKEVVHVDGKHFINCSMNYCTIRYDGGDFAFTDVAVGSAKPTNDVSTHNDSCAQMGKLLMALGYIKDEAKEKLPSVKPSVMIKKAPRATG